MPSKRIRFVPRPSLILPSVGGGVSLGAGTANILNNLLPAGSQNTLQSGLAKIPLIVKPNGSQFSTQSGSPSIPGAGFRANKPANYTTVIVDYDFSEVPPTTGADQSFGSQGWNYIGGGTGVCDRVSDATDPQSPPFVWDQVFPPGGGGGNMAGFPYRIIPGSAGDLYVQIQVWHDPSFEWNTISNKFLYFSVVSAEKIILESRFNADYFVFYQENIDTIWSPQVNVNPTGRWVNVEVLVVRGASGSLKCWVDNVLVNSRSGAIPTVGGSYEFNINSTWGGNGTKTTTSHRRLSHCFIATHP